MRNTSQLSDREMIMRVTFVGKDPESNPTGSPTLYRTDRGSWLVQGWEVTDREALSVMDIPVGETVVEIPDRMLQFFGLEGRDTSIG
jgi:hypothetical protein